MWLIAHLKAFGILRENLASNFLYFHLWKRVLDFCNASAREATKMAWIGHDLRIPTLPIFLAFPIQFNHISGKTVLYFGGSIKAP